MPGIQPPILRDGDLTLRPPRPDDAEAVTAACQDAAIQRWVRVPSPYWVAAAARGGGIAARSVVLVRDWAAKVVRLRTIEILVHRDNEPSRKVALRSGFADAGELRTLPREPDPGPPELIVYLWEA